MADKRKKPKHTRLVLPGENRDPAPPPVSDRLGRTTGQGGQAASGEAEPGRAKPGGQSGGVNSRPGTHGRSDAAAGQGSKAPANSRANKPSPEWEPEQPLPDNAILLSKVRKRKRAPAVYAKRTKKRLGLLLALLLVAGVAFLYLSGLYLHAAGKVTDWYDSIRIAVQPGGGFPANVAVTGYLKAEPLGKSGYAVLGEKDMAVLSTTGREIYRIQHGYASPGLSAGDSRAVVWARGGKDYTVESRSKTLAKNTTEQDILFCEMSPSGWLAVATSSRHSAHLMVYDPLYDQWRMDVRLVDEKPVMATFSSDSKTIAMGCLSAEGGALGSTIHLLRTGSDQKIGEIRVDDARLLQLEYVSGGYLLAVFDQFAMLYNSKGEEMARRDYGGLTLQTADIASDGVALVFGSSSQDSLRLQLLSVQLEEKFALALPSSRTPRVLADGSGVYLMADDAVYGYDAEGTLMNTMTMDGKPMGLCHGSPPLVFTAGQALSLDGLLKPPSASDANSADLSAGSSDASGSSATSHPASAAGSSAAAATGASGSEPAGSEQSGAAPLASAGSSGDGALSAPPDSAPDAA